MSINKDMVRKSKFLSKVLRHQPSAAHVELDDNGWVSIKDLIAGAAKVHVILDKDIIDEIVETNNKKRFTYNDDETKIRANQGHSIKVDVELEKTLPPETLYHGTANRFVDSIMKEGIKPRNRNHVHLSADDATATDVGKRHGKPAVLYVDSKRMSDDGLSFYLSKNGVWLTEYVATQYITRIQ